MKDQELIDKITNAIKDMSSKVIMDKKHIYNNVQDGSWFQGVSTVSSVIPKDWLSAWGAKEAVKFLGYSDYEGDIKRAEEVMDMITGMIEPEEFIELLKEAKGASGRKSKAALVDGKEGHAWLEEYVKAKINGSELPEVPSGPLQRPILQFLKWEEENIDYWILSEAVVSHLEKKYAGTLDALAMLKGGSLAVIDFKFASHISEDYYLQTAGYQATFEPYDIKVDERIIIRLPKTLEIEEWNPKTYKYRMVTNNIEAHLVPTDYIFDRDTFFACLPVKKWINQFKK